MTEYEKERERIRARRDDWEERHGGGGGGGISIIETLTDKDGPLWLQILIKISILAFGWFLWNIGFLAVYCNFLGIFDFVREFCDSGSTSVRVIIYICLAALQTFIIRFTNIDGELIVYGIPGTIFLEMYKELFKNGQLFFIVCLWLSLQSLSFLQTVV